MSLLDFVEKTSSRDNIDILLKDQLLLSSVEFIEKILNTFPNAVAVLNEKRQIIFVNKIFKEAQNFADNTRYFGEKPGEVLGCVNAALSKAGCGTSEQCIYCGALNVAYECQQNNQPVSIETHIRTVTDSGENVVEWNVTGIPLRLKDRQFIILIIQDISSSNRRRILERIFFHDIINYAAGLLNAIELLREDPNGNLDLIPMLRNVAHMLFEEINSQKILVLAENDELSINIAETDISELVHNISELLLFDSAGAKKRIDIVNNNKLIIKTDPIILKRVLMNLIKNALEASPMESSIQVNYDISNESVKISVKNDSVMSKEVRFQIYHKSFSTKGKGRGIGTFSIKLLTEKYLKGKVFFESNQQIGTIFTITLPLNGPSV